MAPTMSEEEFLELLSLPTMYASPEAIDTDNIPFFSLDEEFSPAGSDVQLPDSGTLPGNGDISFLPTTSIGDIMLPPTPPEAPDLQGLHGFNVMEKDYETSNTNDLLYKVMEMLAALQGKQEELSEKALHMDTKLDKMKGGMEKFSDDVYNWIGPGSLAASLRTGSDAFEIDTPSGDSNHRDEQVQVHTDTGPEDQDLAAVMWGDTVSWEDTEF